MAHDHHHHQDDSYFIDQLCMVGLTGAFGVICLSMYFWQTQMLNLLLGQQFHLFVAISGFVLIGLALVRAATLWNEAKPTTAIASLPVIAAHDHHSHDHHHHDHDHHDHHHEGHDHHAHDHSHDHGHKRSHSHDHSHDDHDHGWAPWRYVVMLVPIILFTLGLPNKGPKAADHNDEEARIAEMKREAVQTTSFVGLDDWSRLIRIGKIAGDDALGDAIPIDFKKLLESVNDRFEQANLQDKTIKIRGVFVPDSRDPRFFSLVRFQVGCCAGDAVGRPISVFSREPITDVKRDGWAEVIGKVEYGKRGESTVVRIVTSAAHVKPCNPDPNQYIQ